MRRLGALLLAAAVATLMAAVPTPASARPQKPAHVRLADERATPETRSLFAYLRAQRGKGVLFGHQQTTEFGLTFDTADGVSSDVRAGVGDYPAVFGWDMSDEGYGSSPGTPEEKFATYVKLVKAAHRVGGINTISAHMNNFVTGGNYGDTNGDVVARILPGGDHNGEFREYLDRVARLAHAITDDRGRPIPVIFRPFHENSGSWFWWGAAHASPSRYIELWRYTVEYLRDTKKVHNFLYAYSPGGSYGGVSDVYLRTYPGDDFVDVLGYDSYDGSDASPQWVNGVVADLAMLARIADEKGKVSAATEYGISGALKANGSNGNLNWYTQVFDAIKADPDARRTTYAMTWTNFGAEQFFVPHPATDDLPEHEMLPDFRAFYDDPYSVFADELAHVYNRRTKAVSQQPLAHIVSPTDRERVTTPTTTIRVKVANAKASRVWYTVGDKAKQYPLRYDPASGYHTGTWQIGAANLDNTVTQLKVKAAIPGRARLELTNSVILGAKPPMPPGVVDDFEGHPDDTALRSEYSTYGSNTISLADANGGTALKFDYDFTFQTYTGIGKRLAGDWSDYSGLSLWLTPDGSNHKLVLQLNAGGVSYEAYPSLAGTVPVQLTIPFSQWRPAPWDTANADRRITPEDLRNLSQFNIFVNQADGVGVTRGSVLLDDLRAS
ncbi:glycosyl hydrolase [Micromonospora sp. KC721]|uniref:glycosyl hydrolase n=1 Tax=Micromonospora sp. KC721 TaxID=2530380 RepID=UPI00104A656D|nr:glycosyl hydrolase [Micromonospora sp. KC721]TDB81820.1 alpha-mannosidase [Micromonospora sp. KC721]